MENEPKPVVTGYLAAGQPAFPSAGTSAPAHGAAYPYPAPLYYAAQPPAPGPFHYPAAGPGGNGSAAFLCRLIAISVAVFLVVGLVTFILWLALRPHLPAFAVSSASVSSFSVSASQQLSADFNLSFAVRNPNRKVGISYDEVAAAVLYGPEAISKTSLPPFYQGKGNSTVVAASFAAAADYVDADAANGIAKERSSNGGVVVFHVRVTAWVRFRSGAWRRTRSHLMRAFCDNVRIGFSNATSAVGSLAGPPQPCKVYL
uniref:Uncharacterized protein At1g08160 n=1 Tax=Anthurium amnicola TaxID=1678845 RepID=A0A1D1YY22_9ARAE